jgi:hypothetical protein
MLLSSILINFESKFKKPATKIELRFLVKAAGYLLILMPRLINLLAIGWAVLVVVWPYKLLALPSIIPDNYRTTKINLVVAPLYGVFVLRMVVTSGGTIVMIVYCIVLVGMGYFQIENQLR